MKFVFRGLLFQRIGITLKFRRNGFRRGKLWGGIFAGSNAKILFMNHQVMIKQ